MNNNKVISSEKIVLEIPPDESILKTYDIERLIKECNRLNIPREQYEANKDEDKNKKFKDVEKRGTRVTPRVLCIFIFGIISLEFI